MAEPNPQFMQDAIALALKGVRSGKGGPFGATIVKAGKIVAKAHNEVTLTNDPTAHAEIVAIRRACQTLGTFQLKGCELYTSCEPCPMCLGAIYWSRLERIYYASTKEDAAAIGFDDRWFYEELERELRDRQLPAFQLMRDEALVAFQTWAEAIDKIEY
ncbi:MAG: nucleoside deaminase [Cyanobacteriota bacterium]|nr:nucleoside deaminase [Cyanobacteriota bacterium]